MPLEIKKKLDETDLQLLQLAITEIRQRFNSHSKEIYVPFKVDLGEDLKDIPAQFESTMDVQF